MNKYFILVLVVVCYFVLPSTHVAQAGTTPTELVWQPLVLHGLTVRDPELFQNSSSSFVLTGTSPGIIEYEGANPSVFTPANGRIYRTKLFAPNAIRTLDGFVTWNNVFYKTDQGFIMLASLPQMTDFNTEAATTSIPGVRARGTYVFVPRVGSASFTAHGFPLEWVMSSNTAFVRGVYSVTPFKDIDGKEYLESDVRRTRPGTTFETTCMLAQQLGAGYVANPVNDKVLICPGKQVDPNIDPIGFDRMHPLSSETRSGDLGGLVEGGWFYRDASDRKYYLLYSSGAYTNPDEYAGYVAVCSSPTGPCKKVMNSSGSEARRFVAGSSEHYNAIGRPYPVVRADGTLADIIFHARRIIDNQEVILRCTNFTHDILRDFVSGGRSCEFDVAPTSTDVMMRVVIDYATSSGTSTVVGKNIKFANGTEIGNGVWFPVKQNGQYVNDGAFIADVTDRATYPGLIVSRHNGQVTFGQFSSSTIRNDYEITDGYIEVRKGSLSTSTSFTSFMELHTKQPTRYVDTVTPPAYDYLVNTAPDVIAFGLLVAGAASDRFQLQVGAPAGPVYRVVDATVVEDRLTVLQEILSKIQSIIASLY